ncbi:hypothetical protein ACW0TQ_07915 [Oceanobacillus sp. M60]
MALKNNYEINEEVYTELAEKRAIDQLKLSENEVLIAKAYETTKKAELSSIKREVKEQQNQYIKTPSFWSFLFSKS